MSHRDSIVTTKGRRSSSIHGKPPSALLAPGVGLALSDYSTLPITCHSPFQKVLETDVGLGCVLFLAEVQKFNGHFTEQRKILLLTRDALYVCTPKAEILRCTKLSEVTRVYCYGNIIALKIPTEYDIMVRITQSNKYSDISLARYFEYLLKTLCPEVDIITDQVWLSIKGGSETARAELKLSQPPKWNPKKPLPIRIFTWKQLVLLEGFGELEKRIHPSRIRLVQAIKDNEERELLEEPTDSSEDLDLFEPSTMHASVMSPKPERKAPTSHAMAVGMTPDEAIESHKLLHEPYAGFTSAATAAGADYKGLGLFDEILSHPRSRNDILRSSPFPSVKMIRRRPGLNKYPKSPPTEGNTSIRYQKPPNIPYTEYIGSPSRSRSRSRSESPPGSPLPKEIITASKTSSFFPATGGGVPRASPPPYPLNEPLDDPLVMELEAIASPLPYDTYALQQIARLTREQEDPNPDTPRLKYVVNERSGSFSSLRKLSDQQQQPVYSDPYPDGHTPMDYLAPESPGGYINSTTNTVPNKALIPPPGLITPGINVWNSGGGQSLAEQVTPRRSHEKASQIANSLRDATKLPGGGGSLARSAISDMLRTTAALMLAEDEVTAHQLKMSNLAAVTPTTGIRSNPPDPTNDPYLSQLLSEQEQQRLGIQHACSKINNLLGEVSQGSPHTSRRRYSRREFQSPVVAAPVGRWTDDPLDSPLLPIPEDVKLSDFQRSLKSSIRPISHSPRVIPRRTRH